MKAFLKKKISTTTMTKSRAQLLKSYRSMPAESRRVQNLDPRKMLKGFLVTKLSAYRCEVRKLENEVKELNFINVLKIVIIMLVI